MKSDKQEDKWKRIEREIRKRKLMVGLRANKTWQQYLEGLLPTVILSRIIEGLRAVDKVEPSPDVWQALNQAAVLAVEGLPNLGKVRVVKKVWSDTNKIVNESGADTLEQALAGSCFLIVKLVEEGLVEDESSIPVLVSLGLIEDWRAHGMLTGPWVEETAVSMAEKMFKATRKNGYFRRTGTEVPIVQ